MFAVAFPLYNLAQVEGYEPPPVAVLPEGERFGHAEAFVAALKIPITEGAYDAHYRIDLDHIFMPTFASFRAASAQKGRSEERSVGKGCVSTCRSRWSPEP